MKTTAKLLVISIVISSATATAAGPGKSAITLGERLSNWFYDVTGKGPSAKKFDIETDPKKIKEKAELLPAEGGRVRINPDDEEAVLKAVKAVEVDQKFLDNEKNYIGRDDKLRQASDKLLEVDKPNLIITGAPGVGKTAFFNQVARNLFKNWRTTEGVGKPRIIKIDIAGMMGGTSYRGEMEEKAKAFLDLLQKISEKEVLDEATGKMVKQTVYVYIDEIHQIMGAGKGVDGSTGLAEIFKPYLLEGKTGSRVRFIGSTTLDEFNHIKRDGAFERRWGNPITLESPTIDEAVAMIEGNLNRYESTFGVKIPRDVIEIWATLAVKYVGRFSLPDPIFDMLNGAGARALQRTVEPMEVAQKRANLTKLNAELAAAKGRPEPVHMAAAQRLEKEIARIEKEIDVSVAAWKAGRDELIDTAKQIKSIEDQLRIAQAEYLKKTMATTDPKDLKGIQQNRDLDQKVKALQTELLAKIERRNQLLATEREALPTLSIDDAIASAAQRSQISEEVLRRTAAQSVELVNRSLPRQGPQGQGAAMRALGNGMLDGMMGLTLRNRPKAVLIVTDATGQFDDVVKSLDEFVFSAKNATEVREAHWRTLIIDFADPANQRLNLNQLKELMDSRRQRALAFKNFELADGQLQQNLVEAATQGRINLGGALDSTRNIDFTDTAMVFHFNTGPRELPASFADLTLEDQITEFLRLYRVDNQTPELVQTTVAILTHQADAIVSLKKLNVKDLARILMKKMDDVNANVLSQTKIQLGARIEVKLCPKAAIKLASTAGTIEGLDNAIRQFILKKIREMIVARQVVGGDIIELNAEAGKEGKYTVRTVKHGDSEAVSRLCR